MGMSVVIYGLIAGLVTIIGGIIPLYKKNMNSNIFAAFAAGILMAVAFLNMLPEAFALSTSAPLFIAVGFLTFYIIEQILTLHTCKEEDCDVHKNIGIMGFIGILFHSLIDGLAISSGFLISTELGFLVFVGVVVHKFPAGLATTSLMLGTKYSRRISLIASIAVALATPFGVIFGALILPLLSQALVPTFIGLTLAFAAGTFIYIASTDLIPHTHTGRRPKIMASFLFAFALISILHILVPV